MNNEIRVSPVRVIDSDGTQLGVMQTANALRVAQERGFDLVEVAPDGEPPVCRLLDFGKLRYDLSRKNKAARESKRKSRTANAIREVRMKPRIGDHDLAVKTKQAQRLVGKGYRVRISVRFRGREHAHRDIGMNLLRSVAEKMVDEAVMIQQPRMEGSSLSIILAPMGGA